MIRSWHRGGSALALGVALGLLGCTGSTGGGNGGGDGAGEDDEAVDGDDVGRDDGVAPGDDGDIPPPKSPDSLARNPGQPLVCDDQERPKIATTPLVRLTNVEYRNTVRDLLAPIEVPGQELPVETIIDGYSTHHEGQVPGASFVEGIEAGATKAAAAAAANLEKLLPRRDGCPPQNATDEGRCGRAFIANFGLRAYRRPLTPDEEQRLVAFFDQARGQHGFNNAAQMLIEAMLDTPQFLYRAELGGRADGDRVPLSGYEVASRLSYLLWDTMPDAKLFEAAEAGELDTASGIEAQVKRMLEDPRAKNAMGEFLRQWLDLERVAAFAAKKSPQKYPTHTEAVAKDLQDTLARFLDHVFIGPEGNLKAMLTSRTAFVTSRTAALFGVNAPTQSALTEVKLNPDRRAGLLTQPGLLAGLAHEANHAPVLRGAFILSKLLCAPPLPPPNDVNTDLPPTPPDVKLTTRQRLEQEHAAQARCRGCHEIIDGAGFGLENYDAVGAYQTEEDGLPVDARGRLDGTYDADGDFVGGIALADRLGASEQVAQCVVSNFYRFALSRSEVEEDGCTIASLTDRVVAEGGDFRALLLALTKSAPFRHRTPFER